MGGKPLRFGEKISVSNFEFLPSLGSEIGNRVASSSSDQGRSVKGDKGPLNLEVFFGIISDKKEWGKRKVNLCVPTHLGKLVQVDTIPKKDKGKMLFLRKTKVRPSVTNEQQGKAVIREKEKVRGGFTVRDYSKRLGAEGGNRASEDKSGKGRGMLEGVLEDEATRSHADRLCDGLNKGSGPKNDGLDVGLFTLDESRSRLKETKAYQFWIDIRPKEASSDEGVEDTTSGSAGTCVVKTNLSASKMNTPFEDRQMHGPGKIIESRQGEAKKLIDEMDQNVRIKETAVATKKGRKKIMSSRNHCMKTRNSKSHENDDQVSL
ncbi:hypothetical protein LWI28_021275 [Acer negundo]|uniref:Uncharacterized protein n=1 Tax=Acer negundo TaxID=4023 RepID=A0AAD5J6P6_ACENE|nr:hypothetical protein LWI28_021275 [Acer negundo]